MRRLRTEMRELLEAPFFPSAGGDRRQPNQASVHFDSVVCVETSKG
jgi:hypothetical protein